MTASLSWITDADIIPHDVESMEAFHHLSLFLAEIDDEVLTVEWDEVRAQLLRQWQRITAEELDGVGPDRHGIALLIARKYQLPVELVEHYLRQFERTMPLVG